MGFQGLERAFLRPKFLEQGAWLTPVCNRVSRRNKCNNLEKCTTSVYPQHNTKTPKTARFNSHPNAIMIPPNIYSFLRFKTDQLPFCLWLELKLMSKGPLNSLIEGLITKLSCRGRICRILSLVEAFQKASSSRISENWDNLSKCKGDKSA